MDIIGGIILFAGILIAGSDGQWFPYINIAGTIVALIGAYIINKYDKEARNG